MGFSVRNCPLDHRHHFLLGIRCLGTQIRETPYPALVNFPGSLILPARHRRPLQLHVLRYLHLVPRRLAAGGSPLVRPLYFHRPHTHCDLRGRRCLHRRMAHSAPGSSVDLGDRRSGGARLSGHLSDNAGTTILLAINFSSHSPSVLLPRLHLHCRRHHRKQQRQER